MINYEKFRQTIRQVIQTSGLDVGVVYFILKDITGELEALYMQQVQKEYIEERKDAESEQNETKEE